MTTQYTADPTWVEDANGNLLGAVTRPNGSVQNVVTAATDPVTGGISINGAGFNACELFGASPSASASVNAAAIQAALNAGGNVTLTTPGVYRVSNTSSTTPNPSGYGILAIGDNTTLHLGAGVTIQGPSSASGLNSQPILVNTNWRSNHRSPTGIVGTWISPWVTAVVSDSGHTYQVGQYVQIKGDTSGYYNGIWKVAAVTSTTWSFIFTGLFSSPPNSAGTLISYLANAKIRVIGDGGFDYNYNRNNSGPMSANNSVHGVIFNKIADWEFSVTVENCQKYGLYYCNSYRATILPRVLNTTSDGIHGHGPIYNTRIDFATAVGTGDDTLAFTSDNTGYTQYDILDADGTKSSDGDILDTDIDFTQCKYSIGRSILFASGTGFKAARCTIRGVKKSRQTTNDPTVCVLLGVPTGETGTFEDIVIDGIYGPHGVNQSIVAIEGGATVRNLTVKNIGSHTGIQDGSTSGLVSRIIEINGATPITVNGLHLSDVDVDVDLSNNTIGSFGLIGAGGGAGLVTLNSVTLNNICVRGVNNTYTVCCLNILGNVQWDVITGSNISMSANGSAFIESQTSVASDVTKGDSIVNLSAASFYKDTAGNNAHPVINSDGGKSMRIYLSGIYSYSAVQVYGGSGKTFHINLCGVTAEAGILNTSGTSHTYWVTGAAVRSVAYDRAAGSITYGTTSTFNFIGNCVDYSVDLSKVNRYNGTMIYNNNSALGTLGAAGVVCCQGTAANSWHLLATPTLVY